MCGKQRGQRSGNKIRIGMASAHSASLNACQSLCPLNPASFGKPRRCAVIAITNIIAKAMIKPGIRPAINRSPKETFACQA
jgi:hypothetical protein